MGDLIFYMIAVVSLGIGVCIFCFPLNTFEVQRKFYAMINWRIEPISVSKEIRNTKLMGLFLVLFVIASCVYYCMR